MSDHQWSRISGEKQFQVVHNVVLSAQDDHRDALEEAVAFIFSVRLRNGTVRTEDEEAGKALNRNRGLARRARRGQVPLD